MNLWRFYTSCYHDHHCGIQLYGVLVREHNENTKEPPTSASIRPPEGKTDKIRQDSRAFYFITQHVEFYDKNLFA